MLNDVNEPAKLQFKYPWRPEQKRVLDRLNEHMADNRVHIVAAPGAGKTVLGLEVFNRLGLKTLTLSPTVLVKNQWIERLSLFIPDDHDSNINSNPKSINDSVNWVSSSLHEPEYFTSSTYQGLYSLDKKFKKNQLKPLSNPNSAVSKYKDLKGWFRKENFELLILDEAHHLKASWWAVLYELVKENENLIIVSLTATPPYDSNTTEWSRYKKLCGPVDEEISIPELVKSRSLCPHQDYIWLVETDEKNIQSLQRYEKNLNQFLNELNTHEELRYLLSLHEFLAEAEEHRLTNERELLINIETVIALLQLQKHWGQPLPAHLMALLELDEKDIPELSINSWETLLHSFLEGSFYPNTQSVDKFRQSLSTLLKSKHYLKYNRVQLDNTQSRLDRFNKTEERISACYDIAKIEVENRKSLLRMVVLSDYIRDEELTLSLDGRGTTTGAYPIFHHYIHQFDENIRLKIALLTGRLCIIPRHLIDKLVEILPEGEAPTFKDYSEDNDYVICGSATGQLSSAYTKLLELGELYIIVGTRALLGEGWDAPFLNALVMATQTKAYVATNQLRGRVMRIDPNDDYKTASVWHIVATAPEQRFNNLIFDNLQKRFRTFAGLHAYDLKIESGTDRIQLKNEITAIDTNSKNASQDSTETSDKKALSKQEPNLILKNNQIMQTRLKDDLFNLQARWQNALAQAKHQVFQVGLHHNPKSKQYSLDRMLTAINYRETGSRKKIAAASLGIAGLSTGAGVALFLNGFTAYATYLAYPAVGTFAIGAIKGLLKSKDIDSTNVAQRMAKLILICLHKKGLMKTDLVEDNWDELINIRRLDQGVLRFSLSGYTRQENEMFLEVLNAFLQPLDSSRYLLAVKKNPGIQDLFSIPKQLGNNKKDATRFLEEWIEIFPKFKKSHIIPSSNIIGEKLLLKASAKRILSNEVKSSKIQMIERWE